MAVYRVRVTYADGDNFTISPKDSEVEIQAENDTHAKLLANQMVMTPQLGKPDHLQIISTKIMSVVE